MLSSYSLYLRNFYSSYGPNMSLDSLTEDLTLIQDEYQMLGE